MSVILANKQEINLPDKPFLVILHDNDIRVKVPDAKVIGITETLAEIAALNDRQWQHISTGPMFKRYWDVMFDGKDGCKVEIPKTVEDLHDSDEGARHIAGMIIMLVESSPYFIGDKAPKRIFLNHPETFLHPKQERMLISMLDKLLKELYGISFSEEEKLKEKDNDEEQEVEIISPEDSKGGRDPSSRGADGGIIDI